MSGYTRPVKFPLGKIHVSVAAVEALIRNGFELIHLLVRHREGDYGEMPYDDRQINEKSIKQGGRVFSIYPLPDGTVIWIDTAAGWAETSVFVREEY